MKEIHEKMAAMERQLTELEEKRKKEKKAEQVVEYYYEFRGPHPPGFFGGSYSLRYVVKSDSKRLAID